MYVTVLILPYPASPLNGALQGPTAGAGLCAQRRAANGSRVSGGKAALQHGSTVDVACHRLHVSVRITSLLPTPGALPHFQRAITLLRGRPLQVRYTGDPVMGNGAYAVKPISKG